LVTHGHSKDHRPDLKQAVLELMVSQDGGVPFVRKSWDGNALDNEVFKARSKALRKEFEASEGPRYLIADAKLYTESNAPTLARLPSGRLLPPGDKSRGSSKASRNSREKSCGSLDQRCAREIKFPLHKPAQGRVSPFSLGFHSLPSFLKLPTSSFFFVSTEMMGSFSS